MAEIAHPLEGKIVVLYFAEQDYSGEAHTFVIYRVTNGELEPIRGMFSLPALVEDWGDDIDTKGLKILQELQVHEVYTPHVEPSFLGIEFGPQESVISFVNEKNEVENWLEFRPAWHDSDFVRTLRNMQITLKYYNSKTGEIFSDETT